MKNHKITKEVIWTVEDLKQLKIFYEMEYKRTSNNDYLVQLEQINDYLKKYNDILNSLHSSIELRIYKYLNQGLMPSQAVEKVAEENYLNDKKPNSVAQMWNYYKNLKKILN